MSRLAPLLFTALLLSWSGLSVVGCGSADEVPEADENAMAIAPAMRQAEAGDIDGAIRSLRGVVEGDGGNLRARFELARLQYEVGEASHFKERRAARAAAAFAEQDRREEEQANRREANEHHTRATPFYSAARDNLRIVVDSEPDHHRIAWAYYLLMRCELFFEQYEQALEDIRAAIRHGRPTGPLLAQWKDFEQGLMSRVEVVQRGSGDY